MRCVREVFIKMSLTLHRLVSVPDRVLWLSLKDLQSVKLLQHSFSFSLSICLYICGIWISPAKHLERVFELKIIFITWIKQEFCLIFPWEKCIYIFKCDHLLKCHSLCQTWQKRSCFLAGVQALATGEWIHKWVLGYIFVIQWIF